MCNALSGAYFVTAAQSLFANRLLKTLASTAPDIDAVRVLATGASELHHVFEGESLRAVVVAYMAGIKSAFTFSLAGAALIAVVALAIPFKKLPTHAKAIPEGA